MFTIGHFRLLTEFTLLWNEFTAGSTRKPVGYFRVYLRPGTFRVKNFLKSLGKQLSNARDAVDALFSVLSA